MASSGSGVLGVVGSGVGEVRIQARLVEGLEKLCNERKKILKALFMESMKMPSNERREISKNLFVEAINRLPWDERTQILEELEVEIKKQVGLETEGEEERAEVDFIKCQEERAASREAVEMVEADIIKRQEKRVAAREAVEMVERNAETIHDQEQRMLRRRKKAVRMLRRRKMDMMRRKMAVS